MNRIPMKPAILLALGAALVAGCGGGGGSNVAIAPAAAPSILPTAAPVQGGATTQAVLRLALDGTVAQAVRRARSVSPATQSIGIVVTPQGGTPLPALYFALTSATGCSVPASDGSRVCSFPFPVPVGQSIAVITTYNAVAPNTQTAPTAGGVLGTATVPITATAGATTSVPVTLNNIVNRVAITFANRPQVFAAGSATVVVTAFDAANQAIIGSDPYVNPVTLSNSDTSGVTTLSTTSVTSPSTVVTLAYNGTIPTQPTLISATFSPVPGITPTPSATTVTAAPATPAAFSPLGPRPGNGAFVSYVQLTNQTTTVASPVPTLSPYPIAVTPTATAMAFSGQVSVFYASPQPSSSPSINGTPVAAFTIANEQFGFTLPNQTGSFRTTYLNYVPSGNRLNLVKTGETTSVSQSFPTGTRNVTTSTVWPNGVIIAKSPLTAGDTWTNSLKRTVVRNIFDNRPSAFYTNNNYTFTYNDDGSYRLVAVSTVNPAMGGGTQTSNWTINADGSFTESDVYPSSVVSFSEVDTLAAPVSATSTIVAKLTPNAPSTAAPTTYTLPYPLWFKTPLATDTFRVDGPGPLDPSCGAAGTTSGAYIVTDTVSSVDPQSATLTTLTARDYVIPGAGPVCTLATTRLESHYVTVAVLGGANTIFEAFANVAPVTVQTTALQQLQVQPYALAPQAVLRSTAGGGGEPPPTLDSIILDRLQQVMEQRAAARLTATAFRGIR